MMTEKRNIRHRNIGLAASVAIHLLVLLCFLFLIAWTAPNPPIPEYGIELHFGLDAAGSADKEVTRTTQETTGTTPSEQVAEQFPADEAPSASRLSQEDIMKETQSAVPTAAFPKQTYNTAEKVAEKVTEKPTQKDDVVPTQVKPTHSVVRKDNIAKTPTPQKLQATYNPPKPKQNYGDNPGVKGNKGNKEGTLDANALYGKQGGGVGLDLAGWNWDYIPKPYIPHDESAGRIEFEIKVDSHGEIIAYRVIERSLSIDAERACREAISKLTFTKKTGATVPSVSVGKITFLVRAR